MHRRTLGALVAPLVLTLLLLPALGVLLRGDALPCTHDNIFHGYRIVAMREMLRFGWLFSRWVPNLALGHGYPFFSYREALPYLVGEAGLALGIPLPLVLGGLYAISLIAAGWGAFILGRDLFGERAGWIAGVSYALAPYLMLDALRRGNMPESVGLALLPWLFVTTRRLILTKSRRSFVATVVLLVGLFLSHNISGLLLAPFLGAYVALLSWRHREPGAWPHAFLAVGIAVLLTAWFWLPALTEQGMVQLHLSRSTRNNDFHYNFVSWREALLSAPAPHDPYYLNPPMRVSLGLVQGALGLAGAVLGVARRRSDGTRWLVGLLALAAAAYLWMATPGSVVVWDAVPLLAFVQFPWRLVGRALLPVCLLAGLAVEIVVASLPKRVSSDRRDATLRRSPRDVAVSRPLRPGLSWLVVIVVVAITALAWSTMVPPKGMCPVEPYPDLKDLYAREQEGWIGMDPENSYFPIWVEEHPVDLTLADAFVAGELPERLDPASLPADARVVDAVYRPLGATVTVASPEPFQARWLGLYYPGWQVRVDGEPVAVRPEDDSGLMLFGIPAGEHEIRVRFGMTWARALGTGLAAVGLVVFAGSWGMPLAEPSQAGAWRSQVGAAEDDLAERASRFPRAAGHGLVPVLVGTTIVLTLVRFGVVGRVPTLVERSRLSAERLPEVEMPLHRRFEDGMVLLGATIAPASIPGDGELRVDLLWQAEARPSDELLTTVLLRGVDGQAWSPAGTLRPRGYEPMPPTTSWVPGQYAYDGHVVIPFAGTPPGTYDVVVAIFDRETLVPLFPLDAEGRATGSDLVLGSVEIGPPVTPLTPETLEVDDDTVGVPCGPLALWDFRLDRETGAPGDLLAVRWVWEASVDPVGHHDAMLELVTPDGSVARTWMLSPSAPWWPTDQWTSGDMWVGRHVVRLPGDLASGVHSVRVLLDRCDPLAGGDLEIVAPPRSFTVPEGLTPDGETFGCRIVLVGHRLTPPRPSPGGTVDIELVWEALVPIGVSYRVYLHTLDGEGNVIAQNDGEPAGWTRPTTGWAEGEIVRDVRRVALPAAASGTVTFRAGLYVPGGGRLLTPEGDDGVTVAVIELD